MYQTLPIALLGITLAVMIVMVSCSQDNPPGRGVAEISNSRIADTRNETEDNINTAESADEDLATEFTVCMRDYGFNIPDPELNADGTVKFDTLKEDVLGEPKYKEISTKAFEKCLPLLSRFTVAKNESPEDEIELQDNLLKFAQCLRGHGLEVSDPEFSGDRETWKSNLEDIKGSSSRLEKIMDLCSVSVFGTGNVNQDKK